MPPDSDSLTTVGVENAEILARTGSTLVWTRDLRAFWSMPSGGSTPELIHDLDPAGPTPEFNDAIRDFVIAGSKIVYVDCRSEADLPCTIRELPLDGGEPVILAESEQHALCVAVHGDTTYWTTYLGELRARGPSGVPTTLALVPEINVSSLLIDGDDLYVMASTTVYRVDVTSGALTPMTSQVAGPGRGCQKLLMDEEHLYWIGGRGDVQRVAR